MTHVSQNSRVFGKNILKNVINGKQSSEANQYLAVQSTSQASIGGVISNASTNISIDKSKTIILTRHNILAPFRSVTGNPNSKGLTLQLIPTIDYKTV